MKSLFDNGEIGMAIGHTHHRMLLEDIMGLSVGVKIIYLIHQSHTFVSGAKETWWSRRIHSIASEHVKSRCHYVEFQNNLYWAIKATVCNNPQKDDLHRKQIFTEEGKSAKGVHNKAAGGSQWSFQLGRKRISCSQILSNILYIYSYGFPATQQTLKEIERS